MNLNKLTGTLVYVQVNKPTDCFIKEKGKEWKATVIVDEDTADAWNEAYPKQTATVTKTAEFENVYKIPAPFPDSKKQYSITLRRNTQYKKDEEFFDVPEIYHPRVYLQGEDGREDITNTKLVANGSKGIISVQVRELKVGNVANLGNVLVTELIEYKSVPKVQGSEFDDVETVQNVAPKDATVKGSKPKAAPVKDDAAGEPEPF